VRTFKAGATSPAESWWASPSTRAKQVQLCDLSTLTEGNVRHDQPYFCSLSAWAGKGTSRELAADRELCFSLSTGELLRAEGQAAAAWPRKPEAVNGPGRAGPAMPGAGDRFRHD